MRQIPFIDGRLNKRAKKALRNHNGSAFVSARFLHHSAEQERRLINRQNRLTEIGYDLYANGWVGSNADLAHAS